MVFRAAQIQDRPKIQAAVCSGLSPAGTVKLTHSEVSAGREVGGLHRAHGLCGHGRAGDFAPGLEALRHLLAVRVGWEAMASGPEMRGDRPIGREKARGVSWRVESPHASLPLAGRLVGILGGIVAIAVLPMFDTG
jgi:hypothetical protein